MSTLLKIPSRRYLLSGFAGLLVLAVTVAHFTSPPTSRYIVQASSLEEATHLVTSEGATITHDLDVINAVATALTEDQQSNLRNKGARLFKDRTLVSVASEYEEMDARSKPKLNNSGQSMKSRQRSIYQH